MSLACRRSQVLVLLAVALGCQGATGPGGGGGGGGGKDAAVDGPAMVDKAAAPVSADAGDGGGGLDTSVVPEAPPPAGECLEVPVRRVTGGVELPVQVEFTLAGKPLVFGEPNDTAAGPRIIPTNLRFYLSEPAVRTADGRKLPVDLLDGAGSPARYGVLLVNAEEPASLRLRLVAPAGAYQGLGFRFGLNDACNARLPGDSKPPLTDSSQMTWPHQGAFPIGYLFLRFESRAAAVAGAGGNGDGGAAIPEGVVHMGGMVGLLFAPEIAVTAAFTAGATAGPGIKLRVSVDEIMKGAALPADTSGFFGPPTEEAIAGERLRQNAGKVPIFTVAPASP